MYENYEEIIPSNSDIKLTSRQDWQDELCLFPVGHWRPEMCVLPLTDQSTNPTTLCYVVCEGRSAILNLLSFDIYFSRVTSCLWQCRFVALFTAQSIPLFLKMVNNASPPGPRPWYKQPTRPSRHLVTFYLVQFLLVSIVSLPTFFFAFQPGHPQHINRYVSLFLSCPTLQQENWSQRIAVCLSWSGCLNVKNHVFTPFPHKCLYFLFQLECDNVFNWIRSNFLRLHTAGFHFSNVVDPFLLFRSNWFLALEGVQSVTGRHFTSVHGFFSEGRPLKKIQGQQIGSVLEWQHSQMFSFS